VWGGGKVGQVQVDLASNHDRNTSVVYWNVWLSFKGTVSRDGGCGKALEYWYIGLN
jgi:hypothetical protein